MRGLKICLWVGAVGCLVSVAGLFLPMPAVESIAAVFGVEALPDSPLIGYGVRVMSATYVTIGAFFLILALDPAKYAPLVGFAGAASVFVGVVCGAAGVVAKMPVLWFAGDCLSCAVFGILILAFHRRAVAAR